MTPDDCDVLVIGAGHNGLVAANYLSDAGLAVLVAEAADTVGGMTATAPAIPSAPGHLINSYSVDAFFWDAFPPATELGLADHGLRRNEVDPGHLYLHPEGGSIGFWADPARTAEEIRRFSPADARAYLDFAELLRRFGDIMLRLARTSAVRPEPSAMGYAFRKAVLERDGRRQLGELLSLPLRSVTEIVGERFSHQVVRDALHAAAGSTVPNGQSGTGVAFLWLATMHRHRCRRPVGGVQAIPDALAARLRSRGGRIRTRAPVAEIRLDGERATGVRLVDGTELTARRAILGACDPHTTLGLLPADALPEATARRAANIPVTNSGFGQLKVDLALSGKITMTRHQAWRRDDLDVRLPSHMIGTEAGMERLFARAGAGLLPHEADYSLWPVIPTALDPGQAPAGQDTLYLYCAVAPYRPEGGWDQALKEKAARDILANAGHYYDNLGALEIGRQVLANDDFAERVHATGGNITHVDMTLGRIGPLRPAPGLADYATPVPGLYLSGAGCHPGGGITGGPGYLGARRVIKDLRHR